MEADVYENNFLRAALGLALKLFPRALLIANAVA